MAVPADYSDMAPPTLTRVRSRLFCLTIISALLVGSPLGRRIFKIDPDLVDPVTASNSCSGCPAVVWPGVTGSGKSSPHTSSRQEGNLFRITYFAAHDDLHLWTRLSNGFKFGSRRGCNDDGQSKGCGCRLHFFVERLGSLIAVKRLSASACSH